MVLSISRRSVGLRPVFATAGAISPSINAHCSSVTSVLYAFRFWHLASCSDIAFPSYLPHPEQLMMRLYLRIACQIPPRGGHPCLALRFRSSRPAADFHLLLPRHAWRTKKAASAPHSKKP